MRIIYFSPHPTHDIVSDVGYSTHQREMILSLRALGHEVVPVIIGGTEPSEMPNRATTEGNSILKSIKSLLPSILWRTIKDLRLIWHDHFRSGPRLKEAIDKHKPDFIYERSEYLLGQGTKISKAMGVPHILEVNAPCVEEWIEFEGSSLLTRFAHRVERLKLQRASGLCPVSTSLGEFVANEYDLDRDWILSIPNAINPKTVLIAPDARAKIRTQFGMVTDTIVIGFIGSILAYHGVDKLLEAFNKVQAAHSNTQLMIVGDGALLETLRERCLELGISQKVHFTDRVPHHEVFNYMDAMDICVNPAHSWYGSPIKTFEYGALAKAILAPNTDNMRDVLEHSKTAWLVDSDIKSLADGMEHLINNPEQRVEIGKTFKEQVSELHTWSSNAMRVIEFAKQCMNK